MMRDDTQYSDDEEKTLWKILNQPRLSDHEDAPEEAASDSDGAQSEPVTEKVNDEEKTLWKILHQPRPSDPEDAPEKAARKSDGASSKIATNKVSDEEKTKKVTSKPPCFPSSSSSSSSQRQADPTVPSPTNLRRYNGRQGSMFGWRTLSPGAHHIEGVGIRFEPMTEDSDDDSDTVPVRTGGSDRTRNTDGSSCGGDEGPEPVAWITTAVPVSELDNITREEMEAEIRESILKEAVQADAVLIHPQTVPHDLETGGHQQGDERIDDADAKNNVKTKHDNGKQSGVRQNAWNIGAVIVFVAVVVGLSALVGVLLNNGESAEDDTVNETVSPPPPPPPPEITNSTLELVRERGYVICGVWDGFMGFSLTNESTGILEGINVDQCRAISVAVFGNPDQYELVITNRLEDIERLYDRSVDVLAQSFVMRMGPDVYEPSVGRGVTFSTPYFFSGFGFVGDPQMVNCADELDSYSVECRALRLCVVVGTINEDTLHELLPGGAVVPCDTANELTQMFATGSCNVVAAHPAATSEERFRRAGYEGEFKVGEHQFSHEALALITVEDDPEWANVVNLVIHTFFLAEENNVTQTNAEDLRSIFREEDKDSPAANAMVAIVANFGNYGDLYEKHLQSVVPERGPNLLYKQSDTSGLLYSLPFKGMEDIGPGPVRNGALESILDRGQLRCGVRARSGFANPPQSEEDSWSGLDVEFCKALAGALFAGSDTAVEYVTVEDRDGDDLGLLANGRVDVVAGSRLSLKTSLGGAPSTGGRGFAFGPSYFVDTDTMSEFALMTTQDDSQWTSFVYWVTMSIIYAEEQGIDQADFSRMPITSLFGEALKQCFRDSVSAVGNYGSVYNRTLQSTLPRSGANMLNRNSGNHYGPQHFPVPYY